MPRALMMMMMMSVAWERPKGQRRESGGGIDFFAPFPSIKRRIECLAARLALLEQGRPRLGAPKLNLKSIQFGFVR